MANMAYMEQSRKTCSPVKKYTLYIHVSKESHQNIRQQLPWHCFIHICTFQIGQMVFAVARNSYLYVCTHTKCDGISVELSVSVIHNKTTNKRANEQADERKSGRWNESKVVKKISYTKMANINVHFAFRFTIFMVMWCGNVDMNLSRRFGVWCARSVSIRSTHRLTVHAYGWQHFVSYFYLV